MTNDLAPTSVTLLKIGTSGWSYPRGRGSWNGIFYPGSPSARRGFDELTYYAERFDTVEVNSTFYRLPSPAVVAGWARRTPPGFLFSIKLFQKFTHPNMFVDRHGTQDSSLSQRDVDSVRGSLDPLAASGKLGPLLAQFPPSFHEGPEAWDYLHWLLDAFRDYQCAVELRHRTWSNESGRLATFLAPFGAAWVLIDEPKFRLSVEQAFEPSKSAFSYLRLHGRNADAWWKHDAVEDRYNYLYSAAELEPFAETARASQRLIKKLFLYMNNHFESKAVANALMLKSKLGLEIPGRYHEGLLQHFPALRDIVEPEPNARLI